MNYFKKSTLLFGWVAFLASLVVYMLTLEPTSSLWDCSEFIATSYKMEVGHPPGAPLFMMINRLFSIFAPTTAEVALMVNTASAVASALTIAFLFWTIAHLGRRLIGKSEEDISTGEVWAVVGAGLVGSLGYAFTDTFWFSAVEGEVYAQSSLFTAVVFWAILKWENVATEPHANRWLIFTAYIMGLSIGVHLLNLLAIPAIVLVYYYKFNPSRSKMGWFKAFMLSALILGGVLYIIIPGTIETGAWFDRFFVNVLGLKPNFGLLFFFMALMGGLSFGIWRTHKKNKPVLNTALLCITMIVMGYSTYASVIIRSVENPPMNSNAPSDPYQLLSFLNREQYGNRPLVKGQTYAAEPIDYIKKTSYYYDAKTNKYLPYEFTADYEYDPKLTTIFPRMYSSDARHIEAYKMWGDVKGRKVKSSQGEMITVPTFAENLSYFFNYQVNFMYWRYFFWNFVGRQNDLQSSGELTKGNWLSGVDFIDQLYLGPQDNLPSDYANNKGRNTYYFLPFILGLIGLIFQLQRDRNNFTVVFWLFFMTGIAIILYLNQTPEQPRERDYAYAGSFYAFSIWIGLGVLCFYDLLKNKLSSNQAAIAATVVCLSVPSVLIAENWDDHTRAGRYIARDFGYDYLNSTLPNSIIMPYGDNDTFPLWYAQEVEDVRTDVKVMNLSYLLGDWYVDQMRYKTYDAEPVAFTLPKEKYYKKNDYIPVFDIKEVMTPKEIIEYIKNDSPEKQSIIKRGGGQFTDFIPTKKIAIPVNKENAMKSGIVKEKDAHLMVDTIFFNISSSGLTRAQYMILDMIATSDWDRPIYMTQPQSLAEIGNFSDYLQLDGLAYRFVPIFTKSSTLNTGRIDSEYLYNKLVNEFKYGNLKDESVNVDYFIQYSLNAVQFRNTFGRLAKQLLTEGDTLKAKEVIEKCLVELPFSQLKYSYNDFALIDAMYEAGETELANSTLNGFKDNVIENVNYYVTFKGNKAKMVSGDLNQELYNLQRLWQMAKKHGQTEIVTQIESIIGSNEE